MFVIKLAYLFQSSIDHKNDSCLEHKKEAVKNTNSSIKLSPPGNVSNGVDEQTSMIEPKSSMCNSHDTEEVSTILRKLTKLIARCIDIKLFKNPRLYIYCLSQSLSLLVMYIPLDFLPDMMIHDHNISRIDAGNSILIFGVGSIVGRIVSGVFISYVKNSSIAVCSINFMFLGGCCIGYVFCHNYVLFACLSFVNGVLFGATFVLIPLTLLELFGVKSITDTYGLVMLSSGITVTFGLPILGKLIHECKTYASSFFVASSFYCAAGLLSFLLLFLHYRK